MSGEIINDKKVSGDAINEMNLQNDEACDETYKETYKEKYDMFDEDGDEYKCKICHDTNSKGNLLLNPCRCKGSLKYIHNECLSNWIKDTRAPICEICKYKYKFKKIFKNNTPNKLPYRIFFKDLFENMKYTFKIFSLTLLLALKITFVIMLNIKALDGTAFKNLYSVVDDRFIFSPFNILIIDFFLSLFMVLFNYFFYIIYKKIKKILEYSNRVRVRTNNVIRGNINTINYRNNEGTILTLPETRLMTSHTLTNTGMNTVYGNNTLYRNSNLDSVASFDSIANFDSIESVSNHVDEDNMANFMLEDIHSFVFQPFDIEMNFHFFIATSFIACIILSFQLGFFPILKFLNFLKIQKIFYYIFLKALKEESAGNHEKVYKDLFGNINFKTISNFCFKIFLSLSKMTISTFELTKKNFNFISIFNSIKRIFNPINIFNTIHRIFNQINLPNSINLPNVSLFFYKCILGFKLILSFMFSIVKKRVALFYIRVYVFVIGYLKYLKYHSLSGFFNGYVTFIIFNIVTLTFLYFIKKRTTIFRIKRTFYYIKAIYLLSILSIFMCFLQGSFIPFLLYRQRNINTSLYSTEEFIIKVEENNGGDYNNNNGGDINNNRVDYNNNRGDYNNNRGENPRVNYDGSKNVVDGSKNVVDENKSHYLFNLNDNFYSIISILSHSCFGFMMLHSLKSLILRFQNVFRPGIYKFDQNDQRDLYIIDYFLKISIFKGNFDGIINVIRNCFVFYNIFIDYPLQNSTRLSNLIFNSKYYKIINNNVNNNVNNGNSNVNNGNSNVNNGNSVNSNVNNGNNNYYISNNNNNDTVIPPLANQNSFSENSYYSKDNYPNSQEVFIWFMLCISLIKNRTNIEKILFDIFSLVFKKFSKIFYLENYYYGTRVDRLDFSRISWCINKNTHKTKKILKAIESSTNKIDPYCMIEDFFEENSRKKASLKRNLNLSMGLNDDIQAPSIVRTEYFNHQDNNIENRIDMYTNRSNNRSNMDTNMDSNRSNNMDTNRSNIDSNRSNNRSNNMDSNRSNMYTNRSNSTDGDNIVENVHEEVITNLEILDYETSPMEDYRNTVGNDNVINRFIINCYRVYSSMKKVKTITERDKKKFEITNIKFLKYFGRKHNKKLSLFYIPKFPFLKSKFIQIICFLIAKYLHILLLSSSRKFTDLIYSENYLKNIIGKKSSYNIMIIIFLRLFTSIFTSISPFNIMDSIKSITLSILSKIIIPFIISLIVLLTSRFMTSFTTTLYIISVTFNLTSWIGSLMLSTVGNNDFMSNIHMLIFTSFFTLFAFLLIIFEVSYYIYFMFKCVIFTLLIRYFILAINEFLYGDIFEVLKDKYFLLERVALEYIEEKDIDLNNAEDKQQ